MPLCIRISKWYSVSQWSGISVWIGRHLWNMSFEHPYKKKEKGLGGSCFLYTAECGVHVDGKKILVYRKQYTNSAASMIERILFLGWKHAYISLLLLYSLFLNSKISIWMYHSWNHWGCTGKSVKVGITSPKFSQATSSCIGSSYGQEKK